MQHHSAGLRRLSRREELPQQIADDYRSAPIDEADRVMLAYVEKLTRTPWDVHCEDVAALRAAGFDDAAILDICQVAAYFAFVNRIADGLGVELENPGEPPPGVAGP